MPHQKSRFSYMLTVGILFWTGAIATPEAISKALSLSELEERISEIDVKLDTLANFSLRSGSGSIGYRSKAYQNEGRREWIEVQLEEARLVEEIILVPTISRNAKSDFQANAFPKELRIWAGTNDDRVGELVGTFRADNSTLPRLAPLSIKIAPISASWIQLEVIEMSRRDFDQLFCLQLAEFMVFSDNENVALHQPVSVSSKASDESGAWNEKYLTDGHTPFLMDAALGEQSVPFYGSYTEPASLEIDLQETYPISQVHLHAIETSDTVPTIHARSFGMPSSLRIEGALQSDFSDSKLLLEIKNQSQNESGPIIMWPLPELNCRYLRITTISPETENAQLSGSRNTSSQGDISASLNIAEPSWIGFAEIEILSDGENIAINKPFRISNIKQVRPGIHTLTDGLNYYGKILPIREWMWQLAERHKLEFERGELSVELNRRYSQQKQILRWVIVIATALAIGIFIFVIVERMKHRRRLADVKQRFAADLHDEIGANIHTISLASQLISKRSEQLPKEINQLTERIQAVTKQTSDAIRHVASIQTSNTLYEYLPNDLERAAERILIGLEHKLEVHGENYLGQLTPRRHSDLVLFYQECLINICRHSGATKVSTYLTASQKHIQVIVTDNGTGLTNLTDNTPPPSLVRRAKLLKAKLQVKSSQSSGMTVIIDLSRRGKLKRALQKKA